MGDKSFDFSNRTGQEMFRLLAQRALDELSDESGFDRYTTMLLASLIPVAEVLRDPVVKARDPDKFLDDMTVFISRRLRDLLQPAPGAPQK
ncbi:MAG: hypothetical protein ABR563_15285 [Pyrinomonadaceae bacterium]